MTRIIYTILIAVLAWLTYMNIFPWTLKALTVCILVKLIMALLALILSFIVQNLLIKTTGSLMLKDTIEKIADLGSIHIQTTKILLVLFVAYCLYKSDNCMLLWIYASTMLIDNYINFMWIFFVEKMNKY